MIIKGIIRNIYGLVLVAVFFVPGAFAQGNDLLLVQGDPPLMQSTVDQLVDFFEFGLHGNSQPPNATPFSRKGSPNGKVIRRQRRRLFRS